MPKAYNWQIKREIEYPYEPKRPQKQFAVVMDLNKCIGCQTCTLACKATWTPGRGQEYMLWNSVESKPYGFHPLGWDVHLMELLGEKQLWQKGVYKGKTVFDAPQGERVLGWMPDDLDWALPNIGEDETNLPVKTGTVLKTLPHPIWMFYLPRICNHCTYAACIAACPRQAIYKREEDGVVLIDPERCEGYQECVRACPYKRSHYNPVTSISQKCIACYPKIETSLQPQCVTNCIGKIRLQGFIRTPEKAQKENPLEFLIHIKKIALPLYPQTGIEPNIYYIPPINVQLPFLRQMFGPGVAHAVKTYRTMRDGKEPEIRALLHLFGSTEMRSSSFKAGKDSITAFDEKGNEIVTVPYIEPFQLRPSKDEKLNVVRQDIP